MNRTELIKKAVQILSDDMENIGVDLEEMETEAAGLTDAELISFIEMEGIENEK